MQKFKKYIYCSIISLLGISCDKVENPWENSVVIPQSLSAYTPEFGSETSATRSCGLLEYQPESWDGPANIETRTYAVIDQDNANEYIQYWSEGDAISVFFTTANLKYGWNGYKDGMDVGDFELESEMTIGTNLNTNYFYSIYPYKEDTQILPNGLIKYTFPTIQHYNYDSYANGENGMVAIKLKSEWIQSEEDENVDNILFFQNFCSYLQLRLATYEDTPKKVKRITLVANQPTDKIAGVAAIIMRNNEPNLTMMNNPTNSIVLDCSSNEVELSKDINNPTKFWFVLPGGLNFSQGLSITVVFDDNTFFKQSTSKSIGIARNHIKPMATLRSISASPTGPIRYKYNDTSISEPYPLKNTFLDENGVPLEIIDQIYNSETEEWVVLLSGILGSIGSNSFQDPRIDTGQEDPSYPDIASITIDQEEAISIEDFAFFNCTAETITINTDVNTIGEKVLMGSYVNNFTFCKDVGTIGINAFVGHTLLQTINLDNVKVIEYNAFYGCTGLTEVNFEKLKIIGPGAFQMCTSLAGTLILPESLIQVGEGIFTNTSIDMVYCYAVNPPTCVHDNVGDAYMFPQNATIYVPSDSQFDYMVAEGWWAYSIYPMI